MSSKNVTTQKSTESNTYDPGSMSQYRNLQPFIGGGLADTINNPFNNMFFNTQLGMANQALSSQNSSGMGAIVQRARAMGMGGNSGLLNWQIAQQGRNGQASGSNMFSNLLLQAAEMRQNALNMGMGYRPLQTGMTSNSRAEQRKSGLGTWLPQVASLAMAPFTGGASLAMGGMGGLLGGMNSFIHPSSSGGNFPTPTAPNIGQYNAPDFTGSPFSNNWLNQ